MFRLWGKMKRLTGHDHQGESTPIHFHPSFTLLKIQIPKKAMSIALPGPCVHHLTRGIHQHLVTLGPRPYGTGKYSRGWLYYDKTNCIFKFLLQLGGEHITESFGTGMEQKWCLPPPEAHCNSHRILHYY